MIACNLKQKKKKQNENGDFGPMPFNELAFFAAIKRDQNKETCLQLQHQKLYGIFTQVRAYLLCLKTFEFVSFCFHALSFQEAALGAETER